MQQALVFCKALSVIVILSAVCVKLGHVCCPLSYFLHVSLTISAHLRKFRHLFPSIFKLECLRRPGVKSTGSHMDFVKGKLSQFTGGHFLPITFWEKVKVHLNPRSVCFLSGFGQIYSSRYFLP